MKKIVLTADEQQLILDRRNKAESKAAEEEAQTATKQRRDRILSEVGRKRQELELIQLRIPLEVLEQSCKDQAISDLEAHELMDVVYGVLPLERQILRLLSDFPNLSAALRRIKDSDLRQVALSQKMAREQSEKEAAQESRQNQEMLRDKERRENTYCAACRSTPCRCSMTD